MNNTLIKNATLINEGVTRYADVLIVNGRIESIASDISVNANYDVIDAKGLWLIPGMIDDQVHFREPGLTHKGTIATESAAAVAGGITSFMEMPNVSPPTTTRQALEDKFQRAAQHSYANYSFWFGATNDNLEELRALKADEACGVKVFMGASTGNMLVDNEQVLDKIFQHAPCIVATHCEDTPLIKINEVIWRDKYGEDIPAKEHAHIRSVAACLKSSSLAVSLAKKYGTRLHVLHISTADELKLFEAAPTLHDLKKKTITAEACVHHLFFNQNDYEILGNKLKTNPSVKESSHQQALWDAVKEGVIDIIATDHAPHLPEEKSNPYSSAPSGVPLVQHALPALFDLCHRGIFTPEQVVSKTSHAVAERFQLKDRGYIREGYWADLVLIDPQASLKVRADELLYKCGWSPFEGRALSGGQVVMTLVNGNVVWRDNKLVSPPSGMKLSFYR
ncbi:dihydroorotase [Erwinia sp. S63]|uniref:dihydroorotase n=1 Tax=Erwiniaceae TaxID=1903409 RepID=UPI00190C9A9C|nr:dihydroorotase [Erwinia sp. S59]MBK0099335.1 dihydroorotase [Erwinia sp. S63]MBK0127325.1 dihydroorotase [Pantoea sp. S61]